MRCSFFNLLSQLYEAVKAEPYQQEFHESPGFPIHPSASDLAEQMLVDPDVLKNETYEPGLYDESGDYYPQYSDNPNEMPEALDPAPLNSEDTAPESSPAEDLAPSSESSNEKDNSSVS